MIPFHKLADENASLVPALANVAASGRYILGPQVEDFEQEWAIYCGADACAGVASGFDALSLGLLAGGVSPGDEVIVPLKTFKATWMAVERIGAIPIQVATKGPLLTPEAIGGARTAKTRAVVPVALYGLPLPMGAILEASAGLFVLVDACQAHGMPTGAVPAAFSFYPTKNLGCMGDGGAVVGPSHIVQRVKDMRSYGAPWNSRLDEIQAAVLRAKLPMLAIRDEDRRLRATRYRRALQGVEIVTASGSYHHFVIRHPDRDGLRAHLAERGIETQVHYDHIPDVLSLPISWDCPVEKIAAAVNEFIAEPSLRGDRGRQHNRPDA